MPEYDIDKQLEKHWEKFRRQLSSEEQEILDKILEENETGFIDPTVENPVKSIDFVRNLDPENLLDVLRTSYPYFDFIKDRLANRMRFFAYFVLSGKKNIYQAYKGLSEEEFIKLGFDNKPTYELMREFIYERISVEQFPLIMCWIVQEIKDLLMEKKSISLGKRTYKDSTDTHSLKHDPEAKYSGYYKHCGYKIDKTIDADIDLPLYYIPMEIITDEGKSLIPSQEHLKFLGT